MSENWKVLDSGAADRVDTSDFYLFSKYSPGHGFMVLTYMVVLKITFQAFEIEIFFALHAVLLICPNE